MNIVLHSDDLLLIEHWEKALNEKYTLVDDIDDLLDVENSIIIMNYSSCSGKCESIMQRLVVKNKVLMLHRTPSIETAKIVLKYGAKGYGNALMRDHFIVAAIATIKENMVWLYPEFITSLIEDIPMKEVSDSLNLDVLSSREKSVALLLKDGKTYKEIANSLSITPRTVKAHASHVYKKLGVKDRLALALLLK
ncbi:response regulator transcription factor [Sulfurimonas sp. SAG-AH-194-I05]|nr:LuxR C-terminal-related transcriptional regulator [Sulfurimonas sp. SAG-AH-194-I05]MDF1875013.1 response regulator transcription factor [Sulfurimonas sp. SAG-AH-194-I05]